MGYPQSPAGAGGLTRPKPTRGPTGNVGPIPESVHHVYASENAPRTWDPEPRRGSGLAWREKLCEAGSMFGGAGICGGDQSVEKLNQSIRLAPSAEKTAPDVSFTCLKVG